MHQVGLTSGFFRNPTIAKWHSAMENGIPNIEVCYTGPAGADTLLESGDTVYCIAKEAGICPASAHLPFFDAYDLSSLNVGQRKKAMEMQKMFIDHISGFNIPLAVLHPSFEPICDEERPERMKVACGGIAELGDYAKHRGITLAVENLPRTCLGNTSDEMLQLTDNGKSAKICMDVNHLLKETHKHFIENAGQHMVHMHISDYDFEDEKHWLPGQGQINWDELRQLLKNAGYSGNFLVEIREGTAVPGRIISPTDVAERIPLFRG